MSATSPPEIIELAKQEAEYRRLWGLVLSHIKWMPVQRIPSSSEDSLHLPGRTEDGQTINRPTADGWWWVRHIETGWHEHPVRVDIEGESAMFPDNVPRSYQDLDALAEEGWVQWDGPLAPPESPPDVTTVA